MREKRLSVGWNRCSWKTEYDKLGDRSKKKSYIGFIQENSMEF